MALFTQISIGPNSSSTRAAASSTFSALATSTANTSALPPSCSTSLRVASSPAGPRAIKPRSAPRRAKARTVARPTPADAPVITTTSGLFFISLLDCNQGQVCFFINLPLQRFGGFRQKQFQRRPNMRLQQMSSVRRSVPFSDHNMRVQFVLAVFILGEIAEKRHDLDLLLDLDAFVVFALPLK